MIAAQVTTTVAVVIFAVTTIGFLAYAVANRAASRAEIGSEIELAPNRKPYYDDEVLEGPRLERVQKIGLLFLVVLVLGLPAYWLFEPSRQANARTGGQSKLAEWGGQLFAVTAEGGFNCAGCHGAKGGGGVADYAVTDARTGLVNAVKWKAPALNTVLYRFSEDEVRFILVYGRPFSPMSPWGVEGGGPMNSQQIQSLIEYIKSFQITPEGCEAAGAKNFGPAPLDPALCQGGHLPSGEQDKIQAAAEQLVADGTYGSLGEALFNLDIGTTGGAFSCARCHTPGWSYDEPGLTASGAYGWNLTGGATVEHFPNEQEMVDFIKNPPALGKKYGTQGQSSGRMPAFGTVLTDEQIRAIVDYVRSEL